VSTEAEYQPVLSVTDFWDGPRAGTTLFNGLPHEFRSVWLAQERDWDEDRFFLVRISTEHVAWEVESDAIWRRFAASHRGREASVPDDRTEWGALPEDRARHLELKVLLREARRALSTGTTTVAHGAFRVAAPSPEGLLAPTLEVRWVVAERTPDDTWTPLPEL
jgi:hypothetical protein